MSQPAVSKQLRVLREAGLASVRRDAQRRIYRLNAEGLRELDEWLKPFRAFWERRVDAMEKTLSSIED
jgi:DNA-binding transcriptional ArsR family regulator